MQETKNWFDGSAPNIKSGIIGHYGNLPIQETNYWTMPNGPTWSWWILNILPVDPALKVSFLKEKKNYVLYFHFAMFFIFIDQVTLHDIFKETFGEHSTHFEDFGKGKQTKESTK